MVHEMQRANGKEPLLYAVRPASIGEEKQFDAQLIVGFRCEFDPAHHGEFGQTACVEDGSRVTRFRVPPKKVSWDEPWDEYAPTDYTAPYVLIFANDTTLPPDTPITLQKAFKWAHSEDVAKVRLLRPENGGIQPSYCHDLQFDGATGPPLNPVGRTGIVGRGLLGKWGPNQVLDQVVTRWKRNESGVRIERKEKPLLEVVVVKRVMDKKWALPGGFMLEEGVNPVLRKAFGLDRTSVGHHEELKMVEKVLQRSTCIFEGYMEDPRATDNAWVETRISHVHATGGVLQKFHLMASADPNVSHVSWAVAHKHMDLYAQHSSALEMVTTKLGAYW